MTDPLPMDDGRELMEMVCTRYESPDSDNAEDEETFDFCKYNSRFKLARICNSNSHSTAGFRVLALRKSGTIVTGATIR
jgi:hypothetical protein